MSRVFGRITQFFRAVRYVYRHGEGAIFRDPLTGLYNRRFLAEVWPGKVEHSRRAKEPIALIIADLDRFKELNDSLGHRAGDQALRRMADVIRRTDFAVRWGGDEFTILLPNTDRKGAERVVERLRERLTPDQIEFSAGITSWEPVSKTAAPPDLEGFVAAADTALYEEKRVKQRAQAGTPPTPAMRPWEP